MKQISLILLIITYFVTIYAQDYRTFPISNENPLWVMKTTFPYFEENDDVYCNYIGMIGDTTINSKDYSKIYYLSDTIVDVNYILKYYGALREDSKKIFLVNANEQKEKLVFDFNKNINDTILFDSTTIPPSPVLLEKIDTVILNGLNYFGYSTSCGDKWIAGIGNIRWSSFEICPPLPDNGSYTGLYSFKLDDTMIYGENCKCDNTTTLIKSKLLDEFAIYPNPTNGLVSINLKNCFTGKIQIKIYDHSGKLIHSGQDILAEKNIEMDISFLQTGIYIMRIFGEKNSRSLKLIKE